MMNHFKSLKKKYIKEYFETYLNGFAALVVLFCLAE